MDAFRTVLFTREQEDAGAAIHYVGKRVSLSSDVARARELVRNEGLDVLVVAGLENFWTYSLAESRLAPVHVEFGGVGSALPTTDYFVTSELFAPSERCTAGQLVQFETLTMLPIISAAAELPIIEQASTNRATYREAYFRFGDKEHIYLMEHSLQTLRTPHFDAFSVGTPVFTFAPPKTCAGGHVAGMYSRIGLQPNIFVVPTPEGFADAVIKFASAGVEGQRRFRDLVRARAKERLFGNDDTVHEWADLIRQLGGQQAAAVVGAGPAGI
eukprot:g2519.t1